MRLVSYKAVDRARIGFLVDDKVVDLHATLSLAPQTQKVNLAQEMIGLLEQPDWREVTTDLLEFAVDQIRQLKDEFLLRATKPIEEVEFLPPVLRPTKVIGVGMNYHSFVLALKEKIPRYPEMFHKSSSALVGHRSSIIIPHVTDQAVPEGEVAIIIGMRGKFIPVKDAPNYIAGYTCANDISAKNLEFRSTQWTSGKMLETFCPLGPALVTPEEISDPNNIQVRTILNGKEIQNGNTSHMIFRIYEIVSEISACVTLEVGDVILTGTSSDLGEQSPPIFLSKGDQIEVIVEGIGALLNPVTKHDFRNNS